jgi:hypothetical protein
MASRVESRETKKTGLEQVAVRFSVPHIYLRRTDVPGLPFAVSRSPSPVRRLPFAVPRSPIPSLVRLPALSGLAPPSPARPRPRRPGPARDAFRSHHPRQSPRDRIQERGFGGPVRSIYSGVSFDRRLQNRNSPRPSFSPSDTKPFHIRSRRHFSQQHHSSPPPLSYFLTPQHIFRYLPSLPSPNTFPPSGYPPTLSTNRRSPPPISLVLPTLTPLSHSHFLSPTPCLAIRRTTIFLRRRPLVNILFYLCLEQRLNFFIPVLGLRLPLASGRIRSFRCCLRPPDGRIWLASPIVPS